MVVPDLLLLGEPWHPHTSQSLSLDWNVVHVLLIPPTSHFLLAVFLEGSVPPTSSVTEDLWTGYRSHLLRRVMMVG